MPKFYQIKITNMWHKFNELAAKSLKTGQISLSLGDHTCCRLENLLYIV